jgi:hypothetical protein
MSIVKQSHDVASTLIEIIHSHTHHSKHGGEKPRNATFVCVLSSKYRQTKAGRSQHESQPQPTPSCC